MSPIDSLDARLLLALDDDPDASTLALSQALGIARNTAQSRLRRLAESGALLTNSRRIDASALGYDLVAFISIAISQTDGSRNEEKEPDVLYSWSKADAEPSRSR